MGLSERVFACPCCGMVLDRDYNAAKNILGLGLQSLGIHPRSPRLRAVGSSHTLCLSLKSIRDPLKRRKAQRARYRPSVEERLQPPIVRALLSRAEM